MPQPQPPQQQPQPPHQPPAQYQHYPYPHHHHRRSKPPASSCTTLASCVLATTFLTMIVIAAAIALFILFRPQDPIISITSIKFPSFTLHNSTANFTIFQYASVRNPNRFSFSHHGSSFHLFSSSAGPIAFLYIPAGFIPPSSTKFVSANFVVDSFPIDGQSGSVVGPGPTMELETKMVLVGSVMVMKVFSHHVQKTAKCRVSVRLSDGSLLGYHC